MREERVKRLPRISIVTPSFNQGAFIEETIQSILFQNYPNLEYIVIDGGSKDNSVEVIRKYADKLTYWVSERDRGHTDGINKGLKKITGDIVAYLNSDDTLLPGSLQRVANEFMGDPNCTWITGPTIFFGDPSNTRCSRPIVFKHPGDWLGWDPIYQPSTFWRREIKEKYGLFDDSYHLSMDYEYWVRLAAQGEVCRYIDQPLSGFRLHPASKTVSRANEFEADDDRIRAKYLPMLSGRQVRRARRAIKLGKVRSHYWAARNLCKDGQQSAAWKQVMEAFRRYPRSVSSRMCIGTIANLLRLKPVG